MNSKNSPLIKGARYFTKGKASEKVRGHLKSVDLDSGKSILRDKDGMLHEVKTDDLILEGDILNLNFVKGKINSGSKQVVALRGWKMVD